MADNLWNNNPFLKMFGDAENNPFAKMVNEFNTPLCGSWKQTAAQYISASEEWAQRALEWNEKMTSWAKDTPLASLFETQRHLASQMLENSTAMARRFWQLEDKSQEKTA